MDDKLATSIEILNNLSFKQINAEHILSLISSLSFFQLAILMITGSILITHIRFEGWFDKLPIYLFKCEKHGYQISPPHGHKNNLMCPKCAQLEYSSI